MSITIRELLHSDGPEDRLRAAALSFRSLCEHNQGATLTLVREDGYQLAYRVGDGFTLRDPTGDLLATYPEVVLDSEQWMVAP